MFAVQCIVAYVLPTVAAHRPGLRPGRHRRRRRRQPERRHRRACRSCCSSSGIGYSLGGLLFGIALFRAGVLARWASVLLAYGAVSALALAVLPESFNRPFAVPTGVALIGLGVSLWREPAPAVRDRRRAGRAVARAGDPMSTRERSWPVPVALVALSAIPLTAGTLRLVQLAGGPAVIPADHRFAGFPLPLVVHIVGAAIFALVGILQFVPRFRRRHPVWHRRAGRVLVVAGLLVAARRCG